MVVMVCGLPGSGKSYFANRLARAINAVHISSDQTREKLSVRKTYSAREKESVYDAMVKTMEQYLADRKSVVLDATFYNEHMRKKIIHALKENEPLYLIEISAAEKLIKTRLKERRPDSDADFEVYKSIKQEWEPLMKQHLRLESTNSNIDTMLRRSLEYLR